ncbi:C39 family peptidase [Paenibacillus tengchongensis]|uniref:C39 family peptidase n=1 Tax=Paenibacillus tengchongensis TaxID=2608684 RepID=UPI001FE4258C|nr:C39 family peptidase [Paenibacillus tengchongensis]
MGIILFSVLGTVIATAVLVSWYFKLPRKDLVEESAIPRSYCIQSLNKLDIQHHYECAAFSSAYVLRHFGIESDGNQLYKDYPRKLFDGTVSPKGILVFFRKRGYNASFYCGNVRTLKKQVHQGNPVIAFIRVHPDQKFLHFVPVVGYDDESLYLADSLEHTINCNGVYYNRKISIRDFEALWTTWVPFCKNTYIVIRPPA